MTIEDQSAAVSVIRNQMNSPNVIWLHKERSDEG